MNASLFEQYFAALHGIASSMQATDRGGKPMPVESAGAWLKDAARAAHKAGKRVIFVGNGGSSAIASHMAIDYSKNGGMRTLAFNDPASLTCLGNDLGYEAVFRYQIEMHATEGDVLVAISSSGRSANILGAVAAARERGCTIAGLSGFAPDNRLRSLGDINVYVPSDNYGYVELLHLTFLHAVLDIAMFGKAPRPFKDQTP
jgi:D-sedoheptulose 7-phosphate isomerase